MGDTILSYIRNLTMISTKAQQKSTIDQIREEIQLDAHYTKDENDWYDDVQSESDYVFESHFE